jgi:hypothetical protein
MVTSADVCGMLIECEGNCTEAKKKLGIENICGNGNGPCPGPCGLDGNWHCSKLGNIDSARRWLSEHGESTSQGKPVDHFEVGKWYKWVGPISPRRRGVGSESASAWESGKAFLCTEDAGTTARFENLPGDLCWGYGEIISSFREVLDSNTHDSVSGHPRTLGDIVTDKIVGKSEDFNPSSVKTRSQRRAEILHGLTID